MADTEYIDSVLARLSTARANGNEQQRRDLLKMANGWLDARLRLTKETAAVK